jgi:prephenate dehydrogenase
MNVTIIGLGLIGGSLGLALCGSALDVTVTGWDRDQTTLAAALERGAIERAAPTLAAAVAESDLVVVATPALAVRAIFEAIAPHLPPDVIVTDVASTKTQIAAWAREILPASAAFIGGHPMAGSERHGIGAARPDLLHGAVYCLIPAPDTPPAALATLHQLVASIGARPLLMPAGAHDASVAAISHLPFLLSAALVQITTSHASWPELGRIAATGYRDVTRLASGDPAMHRDICLTNAAAIRPWLHDMAGLLNEIAANLDDPAYLDQLLGSAQQRRNHWLDRRASDAAVTAADVLAACDARPSDA